MNLRSSRSTTIGTLGMTITACGDTKGIGGGLSLFGGFATAIRYFGPPLSFWFHALPWMMLLFLYGR